MLLVLKYFAPSVLLVGSLAILIHQENTRAGFNSILLINVGFIVWAIFLLTAAEVRLSEEHVEFRRFYRWQRIAYAQIRACHKSLHPALAFVVLDHFVFPWGRLYFITLQPAPGRTRADALSLISDKISGREPDMRSSEADGPNSRAARAKSTFLFSGIILILIGLLFSIATAGLFPDVFRRRGFAAPSPVPLFSNFEQRAVSWPWGVLTCTVLIAIGFRARLEKGTWIAVLIGGILLGQLLVQVSR